MFSNKENHQPAAVDKANASGGFVTGLYLRQPAVACYQISLDMRPKVKDKLFAANKAVVLTVALVCLQTSLSSWASVSADLLTTSGQSKEFLMCCMSACRLSSTHSQLSAGCMGQALCSAHLPPWSSGGSPLPGSGNYSGLSSLLCSLWAYTYDLLSICLCLSVCLPVLPCALSAATIAVKLCGAQAGAVLLCMQTSTSCNLAVVSAALT